MENTEAKTRVPEYGDRVEWLTIESKGRASRGTVIWYGFREERNFKSVSVLWDSQPNGPLAHYRWWEPDNGPAYLHFLPVLDALADPGPLS